MSIRELLDNLPKVGEVYDLTHNSGGTVRMVITDIEGKWAKVKVLEMLQLKDTTVQKLREDDKKGFRMELTKFVKPDENFTCTKVEHEWAKTLYGN